MSCTDASIFKIPYHTGTELFRFNIVDIMIADALASRVAKTSACMILTVLNKQVLVLHEEGF